MKLFQHITLSVALLLFCSHWAVAQTNVSDTKLMRLNGQVKSLVSTWKAVSGYAAWVLNNKTKNLTTYLFDRDGNLTETLYEGGSDSKAVYSKIDGYRTLKTIELKPRENTGSFTMSGAREKEEPIEPNEKLTKPDKRFDFKFVYETDNRGRITSERQYKNNGRLFRKRTFEYNDAGVLIKEIEEDSIATMKHSFKYDAQGNVVEVNKTRDIKGAGSDSIDRITHTDFKFDSMGNWTERRTTNYTKGEPMPQYNLPATTYTLVGVEFRTLTYY